MKRNSNKYMERNRDASTALWKAYRRIHRGAFIVNGPSRTPYGIQGLLEFNFGKPQKISDCGSGNGCFGPDPDPVLPKKKNVLYYCCWYEHPDPDPLTKVVIKL